MNASDRTDGTQDPETHKPHATCWRPCVPVAEPHHHACLSDQGNCCKRNGEEYDVHVEA